ncbi:MAG: transcriptional activator NhaR [Planctomycetia bacterium]|jgi:LysR family transcriptional regulator, transcriptional activator of nhaA|nr:transcriptional activator NhaR [Planctomycetia bacterium]
MDWINYHHLLYFWVAAREGSITKACKKLHLTQPTVSGQIQALEKSLRAKLFDRSGRSIALTDTGRIVFRYADEIFAIGRELQDALHDRPTGQPVRFAVGVADALPKVLVHRLLAPAREIKEPVRVTCIDGNPESLLAQLALHELDLVISDFPASPRLGMKAFTHALGGCGVTFFARDDLAREYRKGFPASLTGAPMLLPIGNTTLRRSLEQWFDERGIRPRISGEFADSALLKSFGAAGDGIFATPTVVEDDVRRMYGVSVVGREESIRERFYAISIEKRLKHPAVVAISQAAKQRLFRGDLDSQGRSRPRP